MTQGKLEKGILETALELGTQLAEYQLEKAWITAGLLHHLLNSGRDINLPEDQLEAIKSELTNYYLKNSEISLIKRQLTATGEKLQELSNNTESD